MKKLSIILLLGLALAANVHADSLSKAKAPPTGGRVITKVTPHAEFFVNKEGYVEIRFLDDRNQVIAPGNQVVFVTMGDRSSPTRLSFTKSGHKLISNQKIPAGNGLPAVLQIRPQAGAKIINENFTLNFDQCPSCDFKEYACICTHDEERQ